jgi:hypothetical protein
MTIQSISISTVQIKLYYHVKDQYFYKLYIQLHINLSTTVHNQLQNQLYYNTLSNLPNRNIRH